MIVEIKELMKKSGVKFGTSGARGLETDMTDLICYSYTRGFLQYLEDINELATGSDVAIAGDLRPSTNRMMTAVARAINDMGYTPINCGCIPSPAVALYGFQNSIPAIMVTGSHIPADRNGIKFNKTSGEILKSDEPGITSQKVELPENLFNSKGSFLTSYELPNVNPKAGENYINRYLQTFPSDCLRGKKIGIYQHSAVGREALVTIFKGLGADVTPLGYSETFIPVDTEAIRDEDVKLAKQWSKEYGFDAIISTDGDSDRPLISDENGEWLRGDIAGILVASYLQADSVSTPVSCNTALEKCERFKDIRRTKIGSPYVVASMIDAASKGFTKIVGYEANGGFLTNSSITVFNNELEALPTRDAVLPILAIILSTIEKKLTISELATTLPARYTLSGRIQNFPTEESKKIVEYFENKQNIEKEFGPYLGEILNIDHTDGLRITFESMDVVHIRPSGNAPEFRCYNEAETVERVEQIQKISMDILLKLKDN